MKVMEFLLNPFLCKVKVSNLVDHLLQERRVVLKVMLGALLRAVLKAVLKVVRKAVRKAVRKVVRKAVREAVLKALLVAFLRALLRGHYPIYSTLFWIKARLRSLNRIERWE